MPYSRSPSNYGRRNRDSIPAKWAQKKAAKGARSLGKIGKSMAKEVKAFWDL